MIIAVLNYIENFFILWFMFACFGIKIRGQAVKFILLTGVATVCALLIQQLHLTGNVGIDMVFDMAFGILFYAYMLKIIYRNKIKIVKCICLLIAYFLIFLIGCELALSLVFYPIFSEQFSVYYTDQNILKLFMSIPYRLLQILIILFIYKRSERNA